MCTYYLNVIYIIWIYVFFVINVSKICIYFRKLSIFSTKTSRKQTFVTTNRHINISICTCIQIIKQALRNVSIEPVIQKLCLMQIINSCPKLDRLPRYFCLLIRVCFYLLYTLERNYIFHD